MSVSAIESRLQFHLALWYGVMVAVVFFLSVIMAADLFMVAFAMIAMGWLISLPYHGKLAVVLAIVSFQSAFIVPGIPGRPYLWEAAAMLAWTGVAIAISLRRYPPDTPEIIRRNKWVFIGIAVYCVALLVVMGVRGFGLRVLGNTAAGGRVYFQQIICAILPLLFLMFKLDERTVVRLFALQLILTLTYVVSDMAFSVFPGILRPLLYFFELSTDAANFERQSESFGIRRLQSFGLAGTNLIFLMLVFYRLKDVLGRKAVWLLPASLTLMAAILLSGHRAFVIVPSAVVILLAYLQRFYNVKNLILGSLVGLFLLAGIYGFATQTPRAMQRAFSFLPGLRVDSVVRRDADTTWEVRKELARLGWNMIPDYLWIGKGFTKYLDSQRNYRWQYAVQFHVDQNKFYNGFIGLMVGTGITGTIGMFFLCFGGLLLVGRIFRHVRAYGCGDNFSRAAALAASIWVVHLLFFLFLSGDAERSMKQYALQIGLLMVFDRLLTYRREAAANPPEAVEAGTAAPEPTA